jgi:hypothetical protein
MKQKNNLISFTIFANQLSKVQFLSNNLNNLKYNLMGISKPLNLQKWIDENRHLLKPPVANKNLYPEGTDYIVNDCRRTKCPQGLSL